MSTKPTYEQAQLHLQVYDQRREAKLRQARDWFFKNYHVTSLDDAMRVAPMGSETGAFASMVISYWEQACALLNYDLLHEDLFFETSGEFFGVWEMVKPVVPAFRERFVAKTFCANLEKAAQRYEKWIEGRSPGPHCCHARVHETDAHPIGESSLTPERDTRPDLSVRSRDRAGIFGELPPPPFHRESKDSTAHRTWHKCKTHKF